jgi:hypothetical protein
MARKFLSALDLNKNELQNAALQNLATAPSSPVAGQIYFNTVDKTHYVYSGTDWLKFVPSGAISNADIAADASIALSKLATDPLARANHSGTQAASTISDLKTTVTGYRLDEFAAPTADVSLNSRKITGLADPVDAQDAATKAYVDASQLGLDVKASVKVATTESITLSGTQTVDGVALSVGDRVLVKNQGTGSQNGLYTVSEEGWVRTTDANTNAKVTPGLFVFVEQGASNADSGWVLTTDGTITLDTTALTFVQFSGAGQIDAGAGLTKSGNTLNVVGTADRIIANSDSIDIASTYVGQSSITTLGTVVAGTWNGTTIGVAHGGTGATTLTGYVKGAGTDALTASSTIPGADISGDISGNAANVTGTVAVANGGTGATTASGARTNLSSTSSSLPQKYTVTNPGLTQSSGIITWTIDAATHGLATNGAIIVQMSEVSTGAVVEADTIINDATGAITISWNSASNVSSGTYRITAIG